MSKKMIWNGKELVFSDEPKNGVASIAPDQEDSLGEEVAKRFNMANDSNEEKIGMYGENPILNIGEFRVSMMSNKNNDSVWIETEGGDGGEFSAKALSVHLKQFYDKNL